MNGKQYWIRQQMRGSHSGATYHASVLTENPGGDLYEHVIEYSAYESLKDQLNDEKHNSFLMEKRIKELEDQISEIENLLLEENEGND